MSLVYTELQRYINQSIVLQSEAVKLLYKAVTKHDAATLCLFSASAETESMMKWFIYQGIEGILYQKSATNKQQQYGNDVVGLDRRERWAATCSVYGHCQTDDETAVILQSPSHFSNGQDSRLSTYGDMSKPGSTYGRSGNLAETTLAETETGQKVILEKVSAP